MAAPQALPTASSSDYVHLLTSDTTTENIDNSGTNLTDLQCTSSINVEFLSDEAIRQTNLLYNTAEYIMLNVIIPFLLIFGLLSNCVFLITVARNRGMRTITAFYLVNLTLCDLCFIVCISIQTYFSRERSTLMYSDALNSDLGCGIISMVIYVCYFGSFGFITLVGLERYKSMMLTRDIQLLRPRSIRNRTLPLVIATWVIAGTIAVPLGIGISRKLTTICIVWPARLRYSDLPSSFKVCFASNPSVASFILQLSAFTIFLAINLGVYARIIQKLLHNNKTEPLPVVRHSVANVGIIPPVRHQQPAVVPNGLEHAARRHNHNNQLRVTLAKMLITNGILFFLFLTPWYFNILQLTIGRLVGVEIIPVNRRKTMFIIATVFNCVNSSVNPLVYSLTSPRYRREMWRTIRLSWLCRHRWR